jgi:hypothetical protein
LRISKGEGEQIFYYGKSFGGNFSTSGSYSGNVLFAGLGISDAEHDWDDLKGLDLKGKVVVILDAERPGTKYALGFTHAGRLNSRISVIRERGAAAVLSVVTPGREKRMEAGINIFDYIPTGKMGVLYDSQRTSFPNALVPVSSQSSLPFEKAEISHKLAAEILGVTSTDIAGYFSAIEQGKQVSSKEITGITVKLDVEVEIYKSTSRNVIAVVEGSDPRLKNEYVLVCGHHDARGIDDGEVIAGADDNGTASVALLEIGKALLAERPRRSVILAWFTGEIRTFCFFSNNCPVPVENKPA